MRFQLVAVLAALAADGVLGTLHHRAPADLFADEAPAHVWSASKHRQLRARTLAANVSTGTITGHVTTPGRLHNATEADLRRAREIVERAIEEANVLNRKRLENPRRNNYGLQEGTKIFGRDDSEASPPLLVITNEIADAAALVAEAEALGENLVGLNDTLAAAGAKETRQDSGFWMESIQRRGSWPWGGNSPDFKVFRNVKDYGAKGDGVTDDTKAIRRAIEDGKMCGDGCYSSTKHGAIIYFPSGTYLVSSTIEKHYGTQLIGNPNNRPVMKATRLFVGLGIFSTNRYYGDNKQDEAKQDHAWHINTGIFWGQIRNFVIDITLAHPKILMTGLHYQVSQATSLQYVDFKASSEAEQRSIFAENGSGGHMSDLTFTGGKWGIYGGNQQFTGQRITFKNCRVAVQLIWDWGWTWKSVVVDGSSTAFKLISEDKSRGIGSALIVDSVIKNTDTAVAMFQPTKELGKGTTGLTLDNVKLENVKVLIDEMNGDGESSVRKTPVDGGSRSIDFWVLGRTYQNKTLGTDLIQETTSPRSMALTDGNNPLGLPKNPYFERPKPQYGQASAGDFVSAKASCKGDGVSDDTQCLQNVINGAAGKQIVFVDAGTYILTDTLTVPPGSRIVGENWAQLAATGSNFGDETNPRPVIKVGGPGQKGTVELQDLIFTSKGETAGALFVQWNLEAEGPGRAGIWDCHIRVGGTDGSGLTSRECPPLRAGIAPGCKGGSMMMHITPSGSGYFENAWLWVADHDLDDPDWDDDINKMTQTSIYVARGMLVESTKPTWLYGTSSEHSVYYQYEFYKAANVLAGMIQTEEPYYQPTPAAPQPFERSIGVFRGDPDFLCTANNPCDSGWGLRILESSDITILGAGLYSWFSTYSQDCLATSSCQRTMAEIAQNYGDIVIHNLVTIGAVNMMKTDSGFVTAKDNQAVDFHPYWSQLGRFEAREFKKPHSTIALPSIGDDITDDIARLEADLATSCRMVNSCVDLNDGKPANSKCQSDETMVGYDLAGCSALGTISAKPICCKSKVAPESCQWRANIGIGSDCNGRCAAGEVNLFTSSTGGGYRTDSDGNACLRGHKSFCCTHPGYETITQGCAWREWYSCSREPECPSGQEVIQREVISSNGIGCATYSSFCCSRKQLSNCHWVGQGDCADNSCNNKEVTLLTSSRGDSGTSCGWGRHKSLCCTPEPKKHVPVCGRPYCDLHPLECPDDDGDDGSDDEEFERRKRTVDERQQAAREPKEATNDDIGRRALLEKRGKARKFEARFRAADGILLLLRLVSRSYFGPNDSYGNGPQPNVHPTGLRQSQTPGSCGSIETFDVQSTMTSVGTGPSRYTGYENDHVVELQYLRDLLYTVLSGQLPSFDENAQDPGDSDDEDDEEEKPGRTRTINHAIFRPFWERDNTALDPLALGRVTPDSYDDPRKGWNPACANDRLFEIMGSRRNQSPLRLADKSTNNFKGRCFGTLYDRATDRRTGITSPVDSNVQQQHMEALIAVGGTLNTNAEFISNLRHVLSVWRYLHHDEVLPRLQETRRGLRREINMMENWTRQNAPPRAPGQPEQSLAGFTAIFDAFDSDYWAEAADHSRRWIEAWVAAAKNELLTYQRQQGQDHPERLYIEQELHEILIEAMRIIQAPPPI
ncbi:hypothetical protein RB600_008430 [Gaeumannomyces tritici]